jgi:hypothetical protein
MPHVPSLMDADRDREPCVGTDIDTIAVIMASILTRTSWGDSRSASRSSSNVLCGSTRFDSSFFA